MRKAFVFCLIFVFFVNFSCAFAIDLPEGVPPNVNGLKPRITDEGYLVYGNPSDVDNNDYKNASGNPVSSSSADAIPRYLGFDVSGNPFSNMRFPPDADEIPNPWNGTEWVSKPWELSIVKKSDYYNDPRALTWFSMMKYNGELFINKNDINGQKWTGARLKEYFNIQARPGEYTPGSVRGWHLMNGSYYYQTFILEPEKKLFTPTPTIPPITNTPTATPTNVPAQIIKDNVLDPLSSGIINADDRDSQKFEASQGIPSSENLFVNVTVTDELINKVTVGDTITNDGLSVTIEKIKYNNDNFRPSDPDSTSIYSKGFGVYYKVENNSDKVYQKPKIKFKLDPSKFEEEVNSIGYSHHPVKASSSIYPGEKLTGFYQYIFDRDINISEIEVMMPGSNYYTKKAFGKWLVK